MRVGTKWNAYAHSRKAVQQESSLLKVVKRERVEYIEILVHELHQGDATWTNRKVNPLRVKVRGVRSWHIMNGVISQMAEGFDLLPYVMGPELAPALCRGVHRAIAQRFVYLGSQSVR